MDDPAHPCYQDSSKASRETLLSGHVTQTPRITHIHTSQKTGEDDGCSVQPPTGRQLETTLMVRKESSKLDPDISMTSREQHSAEKDQERRERNMTEVGCRRNHAHLSSSKDNRTVEYVVNTRLPNTEPVHDKHEKTTSTQEEKYNETAISPFNEIYIACGTTSNPSQEDQAEKERDESCQNKKNGSPSKYPSEDAPRPTGTKPKVLIEQLSNICTTEELRTFTITDKPKPRTVVSQLNFAITDHKDHWHVTFTSRMTEQSKTTKAICRFLSLGPIATLRAIATTRPVRNVYTFVQFLLRFGSERIVYYGSRHATLTNIIKRVMNQKCAIEDSEPCPDMYLRRQVVETNELNNKCITYDLLDQLLERYNPSSLSEFERRLPKEKLTFLMTSLGRNYTEEVSTLIRYRSRKLYEIIKNSSLEENLERVSSRAPNLNNMDWLEYMFRENKICLPEFLAWMKVITERQSGQMNTLVLQGPTKSGKSLILRGILHNLNTLYITKIEDDTHFSFENLLERNFAILEEPKILPAALVAHKMLTGGKHGQTPVAHSHDGDLPSVPIFISVSHPLGRSISSEDELAFLGRTKTFVLQKKIQDVSRYSLNPSASMLRPPPPSMNEGDWLGLYKNHKEEVEEYILYKLTMPLERRL
ncbi:uncharacterized protein [Panulirus ornatus]|uniref:uncharacterized protein n=1 Tax=Panulirus ornatus TaxID=150431 RepID=UPI003A836A2B